MFPLSPNIKVNHNYSSFTLFHIFHLLNSQTKVQNSKHNQSNHMTNLLSNALEICLSSDQCTTHVCKRILSMCLIEEVLHLFDQPPTCKANTVLQL